MDWNFLAQSVIGMLVITAPPDPTKILVFNSIIEQKKLSRTSAALKVSLIVLGILGGAALGGGHLANAFGIDLNVFSVVGGVVVGGMGFEMLYGGLPSKTQGQDVAKRTDDGDDSGDGLVMPLAIPLIAGPGAIVTAVSITASNAQYGLMGALLGSAAVAIVAFVSFRWLGGLLAQVPERTTALLLRLGGMLLATIGLQMLLGGLKRFFADV